MFIKFISFLKKQILIIIFLFLYLAFSLITYKDYGLTLDEYLVYSRGEYFYNKVIGNDQTLQKGFIINEGTNQNLLYYNSSYPALLYALNNNKNYEGYHLLNLLFSGIVFLLMYEVLLLLYKKSYFAIIGPIFLFFTPRYLGAIPANPKDIPFSIFYFISLMMIFYSAKWNEKIRIIILGILIGFSTSIRFIGFSLFPIYLIYNLLSVYIIDKKITTKVIINYLSEGILIIIVSSFIYFLNMPYVAVDPYNHLIELINISKKYPWNGEIILFGEKFTTQARPDTYLFIWFLITTPFYIGVFFITSFFKKLIDNKSQLRFLILISLIIQIILYLVLKPVVYNGLRHYLFVIPQIVLLAAIGFIEIFNNKRTRTILILFTAFNIFLIVVAYFKLHPYEYLYFNSLIGGTKGAYEKFRLDYWGATDKEALGWLESYFKKNNIKNVNIYTCSQSASLSYYLKEYDRGGNDIKKANYIVCHDNFIAGELEKKYNLSLLHTISRKSTPLNFIYKVNK